MIELQGRYHVSLARAEVGLGKPRYGWWWRISISTVLTIIGASLLISQYNGGQGNIFVAFIVIGIATVVLFARVTNPHLARMRGLVRWLRVVQSDTHADSPLLGFVDRKPLNKGTPYREVRSAGGKMKQYYKGRSAAIRLVLADGNLLAFELVGRVKTKAGQSIQTYHELRGRLRLNPSKYGCPEKEWQANGFTMRSVVYQGHCDVCFWGEFLAKPDRRQSRKISAVLDFGVWWSADRVLTAIYARLRRQGVIDD